MSAPWTPACPRCASRARVVEHPGFDEGYGALLVTTHKCETCRCQFRSEPPDDSVVYASISGKRVGCAS